jgi:hypothetical protein
VSRGLAIWNDETIKLVRENFIAVSVPTWVCRAPGPEGEFLRSAGIDKRWVTSSGYMNCISASGILLGDRASQKVLDEFQKIPEAQRKPGAIVVPELQLSDRTIPAPPAGGLVLRVHARFLSHGDDGQLRNARITDFPLLRENPEVARSWQLFLEPNTECMWLTAEETRSLVPNDPQAGQQLKVERAIAERMARFHLTPQRAMTSEGGVKGKNEIKDAWLGLLVKDVTGERIRMELSGFVHWGTDFDPAKATSPDGPLGQGFETELFGLVEYDRQQQVFTRFDVVAPGNVWGRWGDANGKSMYVERPGKQPFGFALELAAGASPTDRIPPGGNGRYISQAGYFTDAK